MDIAAWCDLYLPAIYNPGLFDDEETTDEVWESVSRIIDESHIDEETKEEILDTAADWFRSVRDLEIESLSVPQAQIEAILQAPQTTQHSADWYTQRRNRLTASEFYQILTGSRERLLKSKLESQGSQGDRPAVSPVALAQPDGEMVATSWGHRFEPIVRDIYELETGSTVFDRLGRFTHRDYKWLSASPDGIVTKGNAGRLIEIKAPKNRQPGAYVPAEYYVQMQVQMEVTDLDAVDFIEAQFDQVLVYSAVHQVDQVESESEGVWTGQINVYGVLQDSSSWSYAYSRPVKSRAEIEMLPSDLPLLESSIWTLKAWFPRTVLRNRTWWDTVGLPEAQTFWAEVLSRREVPIETIEHVGWLGS